MKHAKGLIAAILAFTIGILIGDVVYHPTRGKILDDWEVANAEFKIRVTTYRERTEFAPGICYVFQSSAVDSGDWREIKTIVTDQPSLGLRRQIRFVSPSTGYIFLSNYYMVTVDGGHTWSVWDAGKNLLDLEYLERHNISLSIEEVVIQPDGTGKMILYPYFKERGKGPDLYTTDFGQHWNMGSKVPKKE